MADKEKRLWGWEKCDPTPDNAYKLISEWYCVDGYEPGDQGKQCVLITRIYDSHATEYVPDGFGKLRHLYDDGTIDRSFDISRFKNLYIDSATWDSGLPAIADPLRAATGHFWSLSPDGASVQQVKDQLDGALPPIKWDGYSSTTGYHYFEASPDAKRFSGDDGYENFTETMKSYINEDIWFEDLSFQVTSPFSESVYNSFTSDISVKYADTSTSYNTYLPEYEKLLTSDVDEKILPNIYVFKTKEMQGGDGVAPNTSAAHSHYHITLDKQIDMPAQLRDLPNWEYFNSWVDIYPTTDPTAISNISSHFNNIIISHESAIDLKDYNKKKSLYPMYFNIKFSTSTETYFSDLLKETNMSALFMNLIVDGTRLAPEEFIEFLSATEVGSELTGATGTEATKRRSVNITSLFPRTTVTGEATALSATVIDPNDPLRNYEFLHPQNSVHLGKQTNFTNLERVVYSSMLSADIASNDRQLARTYNQILDGKLANSETVLYRIEKKSGNSVNSVIQNFYLPNSNDIGVHEFIDTQVKYGKQYTYNIYVWEIVYGTQYRYTAADNPTSQSGQYKIKVEARPLVKLIEVPYYSDTKVVMDKPPTQPNVEIVPFRGISNKFKINLTSNTGKYDKIPVIIEPEEQDEVTRLLNAQGRSSLEKLEYNSDDYADLYEIYRIDKHPGGYEDFSTNLLKTVGTGESTSASTIEKVVPNKKYWYVFRSIDIHGHRSYPSPVYEVEMVDDKGSVYMLMRSVEFKEKSTKVTSNSFKRLMHIEPALSQIALNTDKIDGFDSVASGTRWEESGLFELGVEDKKLWDQTFTVRLTSRKTGRKVDLKVKFVKKHNAINPN